MENPGGFPLSILVFLIAITGFISGCYKNKKPVFTVIHVLIPIPVYLFIQMN
jgi:hypothetical protein